MLRRLRFCAHMAMACVATMQQCHYIAAMPFCALLLWQSLVCAVTGAVTPAYLSSMHAWPCGINERTHGKKEYLRVGSSVRSQLATTHDAAKRLQASAVRSLLLVELCQRHAAVIPVLLIHTTHATESDAPMDFPLDIVIHCCVCVSTL